MTKDLIRRFLARVHKTGGCWEWTGYRQKGRGYGFLSFNGEKFRAHRVSWELHNGPIPDGLHILHRCDNPPCVNPEHLFLGTHVDNMTDMVAKGRARGVPGHHHGARFPIEVVREVRVLAAVGGLTQSQIGRRFGVSQMQVCNIIRGVCWGMGDLFQEAETE